MIGDIPEGLPKFQMPPFSIPEVRNETGAIIQAGESFSEMVSSLGSGLVVVPLIALLENIAICKAFANGKAVDATQELIAIGTANIANSFVQGYPGTGALSRGAVNNASGVRTPMGSLYTGAFTLTLSIVVQILYISALIRYSSDSRAALLHTLLLLHPKIRPRWYHHCSGHLHGRGSRRQADVAKQKVRLGAWHCGLHRLPRAANRAWYSGRHRNQRCVHSLSCVTTKDSHGEVDCE